MVMVKIYTDGSKKASGKISWGFVATSKLGDKDNIYHTSYGECKSGTANMAEFMGVAAAISWALTNCKGANIVIATDSESLMNQVSGVTGCSAKTIRPWLRIVTTLMTVCSEEGIELSFEKVSSEDNLAHEVVSSTTDAISMEMDPDSGIHIDRDGAGPQYNISEFSDHHYR